VDTETDVDCTTDAYPGDFEISLPWDISVLAGYSRINGTLTINCPSCTNLNALVCLTEVLGDLDLSGNDSLTTTTSRTWAA